MLKELLILGIFDRFQKERKYSMEDYRQALWEYQEYEAEILFQMAVLSFEEENVDEALENLNKSLKIYEELGFDEKKAGVLSLIGDIYVSRGEQGAALKCYRECMDLYSSANSELTDDIYQKILDIEEEESTGLDQRFSEKEEKVEEVEIPFDAPTKTTADDFQLTFLKLDEVINLFEGSDVYSSYLKDEDSTEKIKDAYNLASDLGDKKNQGILLLILGDKILQDKKTRKAMELIHKALDIFGEIDYQKGEAISYLFIGVISFILGDIDNIRFNFKKAIEIFRILNDSDAESIAIELINTVYES